MGMMIWSRSEGVNYLLYFLGLEKKKKRLCVYMRREYRRERWEIGNIKGKIGEENIRGNKGKKKRKRERKGGKEKG